MYDKIKIRGEMIMTQSKQMLLDLRQIESKIEILKKEKRALLAKFVQLKNDKEFNKEIEETIPFKGAI